MEYLMNGNTWRLLPNVGIISRFGVVGILSTCIHLGLAWWLQTNWGIAPLAANTLGFAAGGLFNYWLNFHWTFQARSEHHTSIQRFLAMTVNGFCLSNAIVYVLTQVMGYPFAWALGAILLVIPATNLVLANYWVFQRMQHQSSSITLGVNLLLALVSAVAAGLYYQVPLVQEVGWYLIATARWLHGAVLYQDIMEINPPLSFYIIAPPVWMALKTTLTKKLSLVIWVCGLAALSLIWSHNLLNRQTRPARRVLFTVMAIIALLVIPMAAFGQREHFLVLLMLPYLTLTAFQPRIPGWHRVLIGAVAFFGLALKPYFMAVPLFIGLIRAWRHKDWRALATPEHWVIGLGCLVYLGWVAMIHPAYYEVIVPTGLLVYGAFDSGLEAMLTRPVLYAVPALAYIIHTANFKETSHRETSWVLWAAACGLAVAFLLQFKAWFYHAVPLFSVLALTLGWVLIASPATLKHGLRGLMAGFILVLVIVLPAARGPYSNPMVAQFAPYLAASPHNRRIVAYSPAISPMFPLANQYNAIVTIGYPSQWTIPGAIHALQSRDLPPAKQQAMQHIVQRARRNLVHDFLAGRPTTVFIDLQECRYCGPVRVDFLKILTRSDRFKTVWTRHYEQVATVNGFAIYQREPATFRSLKETGGQPVSQPNEASNANRPDFRVQQLF